MVSLRRDALGTTGEEEKVNANLYNDRTRLGSHYEQRQKQWVIDTNARSQKWIKNTKSSQLGWDNFKISNVISRHTNGKRKLILAQVSPSCWLHCFEMKRKKFANERSGTRNENWKLCCVSKMVMVLSNENERMWAWRCVSRWQWRLTDYTATVS